jgi:hypothetical protein
METERDEVKEFNIFKIDTSSKLISGNPRVLPQNNVL